MIILVYPFYSGSIHSTGYYPVGLGYIAEILLQNKIEYEVVDLTYHSKNFLYEKIKYFHPKFIGISLMSGRHKEHYKLLNEIKEKFPYIKIIAGGPHLSAFEKRVLLDCTAIDYGITFEGEETIIELLKNKNLEGIKGLIYRDGEEIKYNGMRNFIENLDSIPFPTFTKFELNKYSNIMDISSSRGCPFRCIFCSKYGFRKNVIYKSPEKILDEIKFIYSNIKPEFLMFTDETFSVNKERVLKICHLIRSENLKIQWGILTRPDCVDEEMLKEMKKAGLYTISLGIESGKEKIRYTLGKNFSNTDCENIVKICKNLGIYTVSFFLLGLPNETMEDIRETINYSIKLDTDHVFFNTYIMIPGAPLFDKLVENKITKSNVWIEYMKGNCDFPLYIPEFLTKEKLQKIEIMAHRKFYINIKSFLKILRIPVDRYRAKVCWVILLESLEKEILKPLIYFLKKILRWEKIKNGDSFGKSTNSICSK
jgi:radical SAM superfamily enzyme YgiQ (UPF0313 family)